MQKRSWAADSSSSAQTRPLGPSLDRYDREKRARAPVAGHAPLPFATLTGVRFIRTFSSRNEIFERGHPPLQYRRRCNCRLTIVRRDRRVLSKIVGHLRYLLSRLQACESRNSQFARAKPFSRRLPECIRVLCRLV